MRVVHDQDFYSLHRQLCECFIKNADTMVSEVNTMHEKIVRATNIYSELNMIG